MDISDVILEAQDQIQKQQAKLAANQPPPGTPPGAPQMPGMAQAPPPGAGGGAPPPQLAQLLQSLRQPSAQSGAEKAMSGTGPPQPGAGLAPSTPVGV